MDIFQSKNRVSHEFMLSIYEQHFMAMFRASVRITNDKELSEDICHDLLLDLFKNQAPLKKIKNLKAYLRRAVTNNSIKKVNVENLSSHLNEDQSYLEIENHNNKWEGVSLERILTAIKLLPEGYRIITEKHLLDGLTHDEIASDLNISSSTSRSQYLRARKQLQKNFPNE